MHLDTSPVEIVDAPAPIQMLTDAGRELISATVAGAEAMELDSFSMDTEPVEAEQEAPGGVHAGVATPSVALGSVDGPSPPSMSPMCVPQMPHHNPL